MSPVEDAAMIVRDLAAQDPLRREQVGRGGLMDVCRFCGMIEFAPEGPFPHTPGCVWARARALRGHAERDPGPIELGRFWR